VSSSNTGDDLFGEWWAAVSRYPAMLVGTLAGQLVGIAASAVIGTRTFWLPLVFSVVLEAVVGVRFGGTGAAKKLDRAQCVRVSVTYSLILLVITLPLVAWVGLSHQGAVEGGVGLSFLTPAHVAIAFVGLVAATAGRAGLMIALARRAR
jgi:hypothetical protein